MQLIYESEKKILLQNSSEYDFIDFLNNAKFETRKEQYESHLRNRI